VAARFLSPSPRDFTTASDLTIERIAAAIERGRPGTAMMGFGGLLTGEEIDLLASYVGATFVAGPSPVTAYHTAANGWPDHRRRYADAYPFVSGRIATDTPSTVLTAAQRRGLRLYRDGCISCHDVGVVHEVGPIWGRHAPPAPSRNGRALAGQQPREAVVESRPHYATSEQGLHDEAYEYGTQSEHDTPPSLPDLTPLEARGERLYQEVCAYCHAADGTGRNWIGQFLEPHPPDLTDARAAADLTPERVKAAIVDGVVNTSMPAFRTALDEAAAEAIDAYVRRAFFGQRRGGGTAR
jgi:cytochrome c oxidase cbb3-type subunit 3